MHLILLVLVEMMLEIMKEENVELKDEEEDPKVLFIGPGFYSSGKSEVLSLPDLTPLDCKIPVFPGIRGDVYADYYAYVGMSTSDGVLMCGGRSNRSIISSCYLLTSSGYQDMPGMMDNRDFAATVVTPLGLWVTGGYGVSGHGFLDTTEIWNNNRSQPHVRLPEDLHSHCLISLNNTHQLLTGGYTGHRGRHATAAAYLYSEEDGFNRIEDMKTARFGHGCSVINDSTVIVAGGNDYYSNPLSSTEYLNLSSLTWVDGPELPENISSAQILGPEELGPEIGGHLLIGYNRRKDMDYILKLEEEGLTQTRQWTKVREREIFYQNGSYWGQAFVVNQDVFC